MCDDAVHHIAVCGGCTRQHVVKTCWLQALKCLMQPFQHTRTTAFITTFKCRVQPLQHMRSTAFMTTFKCRVRPFQHIRSTAFITIFKYTKQRSCCTPAENRFQIIAYHREADNAKQCCLFVDTRVCDQCVAHLIECSMSCMNGIRVRNQRSDFQHCRYFLAVHVQVMMCLRRCLNACGFAA